MNQLTFSDIFRYSLPGGVFLIALYLNGAIDTIEWKDSGFAAAATFAALAVIAGAMIQSFHRAVPFVVYQRAFNSAVYSNKRWAVGWLRQICLPTPVPSEIELNVRRMQLRNCQPDTASKWLDRWADQNHLLWASAWALVWAVVLPRFFHVGKPACHDGKLWIAAICLFAIALIDSWRHDHFNREFMNRLTPGEALGGPDANHVAANQK